MKTIFAILMVSMFALVSCGENISEPETEVSGTTALIEEVNTDQAAGEKYIGLTETAAEELAASENEIFRVVRRDDEAFAVTMDYRAGRINAEVDDGVITTANVE